MKHEYNVDHNEKLYYSTLIGECTGSDLEAIIEIFSNDSNFCPEYNGLIDIRDCIFNLNINDLGEFFKGHDRMFGNTDSRCAIVAESPKETAIAFFHQKNAEDKRKIQVFANYEKAVEWLKED